MPYVHVVVSFEWLSCSDVLPGCMQTQKKIKPTAEIAWFLSNSNFIPITSDTKMYFTNQFACFSFVTMLQIAMSTFSNLCRARHVSNSKLPRGTGGSHAAAEGCHSSTLWCTATTSESESGREANLGGTVLKRPGLRTWTKHDQTGAMECDAVKMECDAEKNTWLNDGS